MCHRIVPVTVWTPTNLPGPFWYGGSEPHSCAVRARFSVWVMNRTLFPTALDPQHRWLFECSQICIFDGLLLTSCCFEGANAMSSSLGQWLPFWCIWGTWVFLLCFPSWKRREVKYGYVRGPFPAPCCACANTLGTSAKASPLRNSTGWDKGQKP